MRRIGLFGGSFNPVHIAHLVLAEYAADALGLERVIFIPAGRPPHKAAEALAGAGERLRMARLAVAGNPRFRASDIELRRKGRSYTMDTARAFRKRFGKGAELYFLIGADTIAELPTWKDIARLTQLCMFTPLRRPGIARPKLSALAAAVGRKEARAIVGRTIELPLLDISGTEIRRLVASGRSIRYLVPAEVEAYIARKGLYRTPTGFPTRPRRAASSDDSTNPIRKRCSRPWTRRG